MIIVHLVFALLATAACIVAWLATGSWGAVLLAYALTVGTGLAVSLIWGDRE